MDNSFQPFRLTSLLQALCCCTYFPTIYDLFDAIGYLVFTQSLRCVAHNRLPFFSTEHCRCMLMNMMIVTLLNIWPNDQNCVSFELIFFPDCFTQIQASSWRLSQWFRRVNSKSSFFLEYSIESNMECKLHNNIHDKRRLSISSYFNGLIRPHTHMVFIYFHILRLLC